MPDGSEPPRESRAGIIRAVQSPIGLFALIVLLVEGVIGLLAAKADAAAVPSLIWGMIGVLVLVIVIVGLGISLGRAQLAAHSPAPKPVEPERPKPQGHPAPAVDHRYEVFVSAPMASLGTKEEFEKGNAQVIRLLDVLRTDCGVASAYYAGQLVKTWDEFDLSETSLDDDLAAIRQSKLFLMLYLEKRPSSVLVEAGYALALGKPSIYIVRHARDLPFILRGIGQARSVDVRVYECADEAAICKVLRKMGKKLLEPSGAAGGPLSAAKNHRARSNEPA